MAGFLDRVRVLDLTQGIAGPACTKLLADWGADVVKVEEPVEGDASRHWGPFAGDQEGLERGLNFLYQNGNKRSVTLNIATPGGKRALDELVRWADIVVESYEPKTAEDLGLTYERISTVNPGAIMVSVTSFGHNGPYRDYEATQIVEYALSGVMYHIGTYDREPVIHGTPQGEYMAAINGAIGAMAALLHRDATGEGQHVDISIVECLSMMLSANEFSAYAFAGGVPRRTPRRPVGVNQIVECADGYIVPIAQRDWEMFAAFLEAPALLEDRFLDVTQRFRLGEEVVAIIKEAVANKGRYELFHGAQALELSFGLVQDTADLVACPQLESRNYWAQVQHPEAGELRYPGVPFQPSVSTSTPPAAAPRLGQHNQEVLEGVLGLPLQELERDGAFSR
ncbi:MAG: CoA transferase [Dehalococcoidia bacterium]